MTATHVNTQHNLFSKMVQFPEQVELIERVKAALGVTEQGLAPLVSVRPETLAKYAAGNQKAGERLMRLLEELLVKHARPLPSASGRTASQERFSRNVTHAKQWLMTKSNGWEEPPALNGPAGDSLSPQEQLDAIILGGDKEEVGAVCSMLGAIHKQIAGRQNRGQIVQSPRGTKLRPLLGRIPAGLPSEAIAQADEFVPVPDDLAPEVDFALRVSGESMSGRGLHDGDIVFMTLRREASNGSVVAALFDEDEATLKTYVSRNGEIYLKPENPNYPDRLVPRRELQVQGVMVGKLA